MEKQKVAKKAVAKKVETKKVDHSNPFNEGVTYESFLKELGKADLVKHLEGKKCTKDEIEWIKGELKNYKNKK